MFKISQEEIDAGLKNDSIEIGATIAFYKTPQMMEAAKQYLILAAEAASAAENKNIDYAAASAKSNQVKAKLSEMIIENNPVLQTIEDEPIQRIELGNDAFKKLFYFIMEVAVLKPGMEEIEAKIGNNTMRGKNEPDLGQGYMNRLASKTAEQAVATGKISFNDPVLQETAKELSIIIDARTSLEEKYLDGKRVSSLSQNESEVFYNRPKVREVEKNYKIVSDKLFDLIADKIGYGANFTTRHIHIENRAIEQKIFIESVTVEKIAEKAIELVKGAVGKAVKESRKPNEEALKTYLEVYFADQGRSLSTNTINVIAEHVANHSLGYYQDGDQWTYPKVLKHELEIYGISKERLKKSDIVRNTPVILHEILSGESYIEAAITAFSKGSAVIIPPQYHTSFSPEVIEESLVTTVEDGNIILHDRKGVFRPQGEPKKEAIWSYVHAHYGDVPLNGGGNLSSDDISDITEKVVDNLYGVNEAGEKWKYIDALRFALIEKGILPIDLKNLTGEPDALLEGILNGGNYFDTVQETLRKGEPVKLSARYDLVPGIGRDLHVKSYAGYEVLHDKKAMLDRLAEGEAIKIPVFFELDLETIKNFSVHRTTEFVVLQDKEAAIANGKPIWTKDNLSHGNSDRFKDISPNVEQSLILERGKSVDDQNPVSAGEAALAAQMSKMDGKPVHGAGFDGGNVNDIEPYPKIFNIDEVQDKHEPKSHRLEHMPPAVERDDEFNYYSVKQLKPEQDERISGINKYPDKSSKTMVERMMSRFVPGMRER